MTRYEAMTKAIEMAEIIEKIAHDNAVTHGSEWLQALRNIAKDIRYGGEWHGNCEELVTALEKCSESRECNTCPRRGLIGFGSCTSNLKIDAAAALRAMEQKLKEKGGEI